AVLSNEFQSAGSYSVSFNGAGLSTGVYLCRMDCNEFHSVKKLTLLK
ncbi:MAG: peptidase S8, partial [Ignavibacteriales bacterium]|nr:peptidase S8 [Ignavibacteriales bacterium]